MGPISSTEATEPRGAGGELSGVERGRVLAVARASIEHGLARGGPLPVDPTDFAPALRAVRSCFVTLYRGGQLRGCVGSLLATLPLVVDVSRNAFASAFRDTRFRPLERDELEGLEISVSILSPPARFEVSSEADLLAKVRPGVDGLVLRDGGHAGTFLPAVWKRFPEPRDFVAQLKLKAGLPASYWSTTLSFERYTTESFSESGSDEDERPRI
ncbi:MAG: AmmeMemoRadiSam system protein A [Myxococcales bacterium]|nr:AmmeMemoRadiSam system protein A [Myxococcales bacterium]